MPNVVLRSQQFFYAIYVRNRTTLISSNAHYMSLFTYVFDLLNNVFHTHMYIDVHTYIQWYDRYDRKQAELFVLLSE